MSLIPLAELWRRVAVVSGIDATYGAPFGGLWVVPVPGTVAPLFARAHQRVHGTRAMAHRGDGSFWVPGRDAGPRLTVEVDSAEALVAAVPTLAAAEVEVRVALDPTQPVEESALWPLLSDENWSVPADEAVEAMRAAAHPLLLAGPGVIRHLAVAGLHDLAVSAGVGVLNTWGAKGVFDWRSRYHFATIGLQADDFVLSGLEEADLIIATGLDPAESPEEQWRLAPALTVPPAGLAPLAERCGSDRRTITMPPLRARLAEVTQRGWSVDASPLPPSRATMHYGECVAAGALVAADAGHAGFWVARTLGTTRLGAVIVPSTPSPGLAAACVAVSLLRRPNRPALAVLDLAEAESSAVVTDAAAALGVRVPVEAWDPEGDALNADAHRDRLRQLLLGGLPTGDRLCSLRTDPHQLAEMVEAAGPIVAWT